MPTDPPDRDDSPAPPPAAECFDAGDMSCGDLVIALRPRLRALNPGDVLRVTATDPGAPTDLPAYCRLTGHTMVASRHPDYWIRRKPD